MKENSKSPVWNVELFPVVQDCLAYIHDVFFKACDSWNSETKGLHLGHGYGAGIEGHEIGHRTVNDLRPRAVDVYKEYLRRDLASKIARAAS